MTGTGSVRRVSPMMTPEEAAELLRIDVDELEAMRVAGDVAQPVVIARASLYWRSSIDELLSA